VLYQIINGVYNTKMTELVAKLSKLNRKRKQVSQADVIEGLEVMLLLSIFVTCTYAVAPII
jgi:hypothetical protein